MFYGLRSSDSEDSVFAPIVALSLFTLSAAVMSYVFFFQPVQLYLDGKKKQAADLFMKTLLYFAAITLAVLIIFFSGVYKLIL